MQGWMAHLPGRHQRLDAILALVVQVSLLVAGCGDRPDGVDATHRPDRLAPPAAPSGVPVLGRSALTIARGVHILGGLSPSAAYVVETSEGLVLVDSGLDDDAGRLKSQMAELGLDWKDVRAILLTHAHGDHCGGAQHLRASTGAKVYAGQGDAPVLRAGGPREAFFSTFFMPDHSPHPTTVDVELKGGESIAIGSVRFRALAMPGHTPGSICYLMERDNLRALFAGDVIMMLLGDEHPHSEIRKPLGTYSAYLAPRYRGDAGTFLSSLRELRKLPVPNLVFPGHPGADARSQSPSISQGRWETLLDGGIHDMEVLLARYEGDGANFLDGHPRRLLPDLYYLGDFRGAAVYGFFASSRFFLVDAPGGAGLLDFIGASLGQLGLKPTPPVAVLLTSCGPEATAGLKELVEKCQAQVVASSEGIRIVQELCPAGTVVLSAEELPGRGWFPVSPVALGGRGLAPVAYRLPWAGKAVLLSGRIPILVNQTSGSALFSDFLESRGNVRDYIGSLGLLSEPIPDLWLPAVPTNDQNANLYENSWKTIIGDNRAVIERNASLLNRP
jgi:glyoxylase-like metal-dependent hydrolase (beta-lactamase superfamily II)